MSHPYGDSPLRDGRIQTNEIADGAVTREKIADSAVIYIVTLEEDDGDYSLDKNYKEIKAAVESGLIPYVDTGEGYWIVWSVWHDETNSLYKVGFSDVEYQSETETGTLAPAGD